MNRMQIDELVLLRDLGKVASSLNCTSGEAARRLAHFNCLPPYDKEVGLQRVAEGENPVEVLREMTAVEQEALAGLCDLDHEDNPEY